MQRNTVFCKSRRKVAEKSPRYNRSKTLGTYDLKRDYSLFWHSALKGGVVVRRKFALPPFPIEPNLDRKPKRKKMEIPENGFPVLRYFHQPHKDLGEILSPNPTNLSLPKSKGATLSISSSSRLCNLTRPFRYQSLTAPFSLL